MSISYSTVPDKCNTESGGLLAGVGDRDYCIYKSNCQLKYNRHNKDLHSLPDDT